MSHDNIWRFIIDPPLPPARNMAIDEAISIAFANNKTSPTLRLYQWASPALTLGSFQKIDPTLRHFLEENPVTLLRRITGGQALLHDRDFTYSIIASTHDPLFSGGIKKTFYSIAQGLLAALARLGVAAEIYTPMRDVASLQERMGRSPRRGRSPFCAASLSWYEIAVDGKKLIGSAQRRWVHHFLQHGSLPALPEIEHAIQIGFATAWSIRLEKGYLTSEEVKLADALVVEKYNNAAWTEERKLPASEGVSYFGAAH